MEQKYGEEIRYSYCPICKKESKDNPHFSVNTKTGKYYCFVTGEGGNAKDLGFEVEASVEAPLPKTTDFTEKFLDTAKPLDKEWLEYLKGRGISDKWLTRFCRMNSKKIMMIPLTNGKEVIGIKYRSLNKDCRSEKGSATDYFLNWQNIKDFSYLIIVEGEIDLLSAIEAGFDNVVSLPFGSKNLKCIDTQKNWLKKFSKIIIATDNDKPGTEAREGIIEKLTSIKKKLYKVELGNFKDFNEVLTNAGKETLKEIIKNNEKIEKEFQPYFLEDDGYYYFIKENYTRLTTFTLDIKGHSNSYIFGTVKTDGREREFKATKTELLTKNGMLEHLGYYLGSSQSTSKFWAWILEQHFEDYIEEIEHYGILEEKYYDKGSKIICDKEDLKIQNLNDIEDITEEDREWINANLIYLRSDVNQSLLGICWALGRLHVHENYPILEVAGTTSVGKSEYVEFISRILFGDKENVKSFTTLTNHQVRSLSSCSNITPWAIDEIKITGKNLKEKAVELYSTIRAVFDNKTLNQGTVTKKMNTFKLRTPLIISGETEFSDVSIKNRMISTELTKRNKSAEEVFLKLKHSKILEKFGKLALKDRLENGQIVLELDKVREFLQEVKDDRQLYNGKCVLTGFKAFTRLVKINNDLKLNFLKHVNTLLAHEYNIESNFKELLNLVLESDTFLESFYKKENSRCFVRFNLLYKAIAEEHYKTNSTLELLDARTLKKQLIEEGILSSALISTRFPKDTFTKETIAVKTHELFLVW